MKREIVKKCLQVRGTPTPTPTSARMEFVQAIGKPEYAHFDDAERRDMVSVLSVGTGRGHDNFRRRHLWNRTRSDRLNPTVLGDVNPSVAVCSTDGEEFLLFEDEHTAYIGSRRLWENVLHSSEIKNILSDGRFKQIPSSLRSEGNTPQLYTIMVELQRGHTVPFLFSIISRPTGIEYSRMFRWLKDQLGTSLPLLFRPGVKFLMDFEIAAMDSAEAELGADVHGCLFHFAQCIRRKRDALGLRRAASKNAAMFCFFFFEGCRCCHFYLTTYTPVPECCSLQSSQLSHLQRKVP